MTSPETLWIIVFVLYLLGMAKTVIDVAEACQEDGNKWSPIETVWCAAWPVVALVTFAVQVVLWAIPRRD